MSDLSIPTQHDSPSTSKRALQAGPSTSFSFGFESDEETEESSTKTARGSESLPVDKHQELFDAYDRVLSNFTTTPYRFVVARDYMYSMFGCVITQGQLYQVNWLDSGVHQLSLQPVQFKPEIALKLLSQAQNEINSELITASSSTKPLVVDLINILNISHPISEDDIQPVPNAQCIAVSINLTSFVATPNQLRAIHTASNPIIPSTPAQGVDRTDNVSALQGDYFGHNLISLFPFLYNMTFPTTAHRHEVDMRRESYISQEAAQQTKHQQQQQSFESDCNVTNASTRITSRIRYGKLTMQDCSTPLSVDQSLSSWIWPVDHRSFVNHIYTRTCFAVQCGGQRLHQYIRPDFAHFRVPQLIAQSSSSIIWMKSLPQQHPVSWLGQQRGDRSVSYLASTPDMSYHAYLAGHTIYFNPPEHIQAKYVKSLAQQLGHIFGYLPVGSDFSSPDDDSVQDHESGFTDSIQDNENGNSSKHQNDDGSGVRRSSNNKTASVPSAAAAASVPSGEMSFLDEMGSFGGDLEIFAVAGPHVTPWHLDAQDNFSIQLVGTKKWSVVRGPINASTNAHPKSTSKRALVADKHTLQCDADQDHAYIEKLLQSTSQSVPPPSISHFVSPAVTLDSEYAFSNQNKTPMSAALLDSHPDKETFIVYPGTIFYHPAGTYHRVDALDQDSGSLSINISLDVLRYCDLLLQFFAKSLSSNPLLRQRVSLGQSIDPQEALASGRMVPQLIQTVLESLLPQIVQDLTADNIFVPALVTTEQLHDFGNLSSSTPNSVLQSDTVHTVEAQAHATPHQAVSIAPEFAANQILWREHGCVNLSKYITSGGFNRIQLFPTLLQLTTNREQFTLAIQEQNQLFLRGFCSKFNSFVNIYLQKLGLNTPTFVQQLSELIQYQFHDVTTTTFSSCSTCWYLLSTIPSSITLYSSLHNITLQYNPFVHVVTNEPAWIEMPQPTLLSQFFTNATNLSISSPDQMNILSTAFHTLFDSISKHQQISIISKHEPNCSSQERNIITHSSLTQHHRQIPPLDLSTLPLLITGRRMAACYHLYSICIASGVISTSSSIPFSSDPAASSSRNPPAFTIGVVLDATKLSSVHKNFQQHNTSALRSAAEANAKLSSLLLNDSTTIVSHNNDDCDFQPPVHHLWSLHASLFLMFIINHRIACVNFNVLYEYLAIYLQTTARLYEQGLTRDVLPKDNHPKQLTAFVHYYVPSSLELICFLLNFIAIMTHVGVFQKQKQVATTPQ